MPRPLRYKIGDKVGELTILREAPKGPSGATNFVVSCACGSPERIVRAGALTRTRSCGKCLQHKCLSIGVFGDLTVLTIYPGAKGVAPTAKCLCKCGRTHLVSVHHLMNGNTKSCRKCYLTEFPIGATVGSWRILGFTKSPRGDTDALCQCLKCESKETHRVALSSLRTGNSSQCRRCRDAEGANILIQLAQKYRETLGLSPEEKMSPKSAQDRQLFAEVATATKIRDEHTCQLCGCVGGYLHSHHVFRYADFPQLLLDPMVVITLCEKCHQKAHQHNWRGPLDPNIQFQLLERLAVIYGTTLMEIYQRCLALQKKPA